MYRLLFGADLDEHADAMRRARRTRRDVTHADLLRMGTQLAGTAAGSTGYVPKLSDLFGDQAGQFVYLDK